MKKLLLLTVMFFFIAFVVAQEQHVNYKLPDGNQSLMFLFGEKDKDTAVVKVLMENAPRYFNAPGMPRFSIIGKDRKFYLGIGGFLRATVSYDINNPITNVGNSFFTPASITDVGKGNRGLVQFGAQTSTINVNFVGLPDTKNQIGVYFNINLTGGGGNYTPFVLNAYAKYRGFTAGYTFSLFTDLMAGPPTIDFQGPNSWTLLPNAVVDYEQKFGKHWGIGIGLEMPIVNYTTTTDITKTVNQVVPDIPAYVQYSWNNRSSWIRFSGILRNIQYFDIISDTKKNNIAGGGKISGSSAIGKHITTYYQVVAGKGISNYVQGINGGKLDMTPSSTDGILSNVGIWGGYVGVQYNFTPNVFVSCTYSRVNTFDNPYYQAVQYKNAQYIVGNIFWTINSVVQLGLEYLYGDRQNMNNVTNNDHRIQTMLQVNF